MEIRRFVTACVCAVAMTTGWQIGSAAAAIITFEIPALGTADRQVINPYQDPATGVTFTAEPNELFEVAVGLVKNSATSACAEPANADQKLGTGVTTLPDGAIGLSTWAIRAAFPNLLPPPATVSVDFQTLAGA